MTLWQLIKRELRLIFIKDPRRAVYLFGACATYIVLFGLLYGTHVINSIPTVVYDQDQTSLSRSLVQAFDNSERYQIIASVTSQEDMEEYLHNKTALTAITIPPKFSGDIKTGHAASVLVEVNAGNIAIANAALSSAQEIVLSFSNNTGAQLMEYNSQLPNQALHKVAPIDFRLRILHNSTLSYLDFFVLGLAMAALQQGILLSVGASMIIEYQNIQELQNIHPLKVIAGKLLPYWLCGTFSFVMALTIATTIFDIPFKGDYASLLILGTVFSFTITALASLMAAICQSEVTYTQLSLSYAVPAFIFSGYTWPQHSMDTFSLILSYTFPLSYFADTIRALMVSGHAPLLAKNITILLFMGTIMLTISTLIYIYKRKHLPCTEQNSELSQIPL